MQVVPRASTLEWVLRKQIASPNAKIILYSNETALLNFSYLIDNFKIADINSMSEIEFLESE